MGMGHPSLFTDAPRLYQRDSPQQGTAPMSDTEPPKDLPPAAQRALAEAEARRKAAEASRPCRRSSAAATGRSPSAMATGNEGDCGRLLSLTRGSGPPNMPSPRSDGEAQRLAASTSTTWQLRANVMPPQSISRQKIAVLPAPLSRSRASPKALPLISPAGVTLSDDAEARRSSRPWTSPTNARCP